MRPTRAVAIALLAVLVGWSESAAAGIDISRTNGWHTWQVDEAETATGMCCFAWRRGSPSQVECDLDGRHAGFSSSDDCAAEPGPVRLYALIADGDLVKVLALSAACPVTTATTIRDHGVITAAENLAWFRGVIEDRNTTRSVRENALIGLVQTQTDAAYAYIDGLLSHN